MTEPETFDGELKALLREGTSHEVPDDLAPRLRARLAGAIPALGETAFPTGHAASTSTAPPRLRSPFVRAMMTKGAVAVVSAALGSVVGAAIMHGIDARRLASSPAAASNSASPTILAAPLSPQTPSIPFSAPPSEPSSKATIGAIPSTPPSATANARVAERILLDSARTAYARGELEAARSALVQHRERYPNGAFAEEREALSVRLFHDMGRDADAKEAGERFRARYPKSLMLPAVEATLEQIP